MRNRNIKIPLFILGSLVILSFAFFSIAQENSATNKNVFLDSDQDGLADTEEKTYGTDPAKSDTDGDGYSDGAEVKTGYDPLRPAPGDKVIAENKAPKKETSASADGENLTNKISSKVSALMENADSQTEITMGDIQNIVDETVSPSFATAEIPEISKDEIKIKKTNYKNLSDEKKKAKQKEDFLSYMSAVSYILSSNSPKPITSTSNIPEVGTALAQQMVSAITTRDPSAVSDLSQSGEKMLEQMKEVEVPEDLVDLHIKGLRFANYALNLKGAVALNTEDPFADMLNLSKMQSFLEVVAGYSDEIKNKFSELGVTAEDTEKELEKLGISTDENGSEN